MCVQAAADAFLDAMASHDASAVPLAAGATQHINQRPIANPAANLQHPNGISAITGRETVIEGDRAVALYDIVVPGGVYHAATRFHIVGALITDIDAVCSGAELCGS